MNRICSNESFPRNIILSIDADEKNYQLNLAAFRNYFQNALGEGIAPQEAVDISVNKLKDLVNKRKEIFISKRENKKDYFDIPKVSEEKPVTLTKLREEGDLIKRLPKTERKERIIKRLSDLTGESEEKLSELWQTFLQRRKNVESDGLALRKTINEYNKAKEPEVKIPPTIDEIRKYYNIVANLEPENSENNIEQFKKYVLKEMSLTSALNKIRYIISARNFMRENGISVTSKNVLIFLVSDGDFELAAKRIRETEESGKLGIDVDNLNAPYAVNDQYIIYNGKKVSLYRLVYYLFKGKTTKNQLLTMYVIIKKNIFDLGMSVDEAVENAYKELNIRKFRDQLKKEFPEDPSYAEHVLESYYIDENMSFQDALDLTRKDLGKKAL